MKGRVKINNKQIGEYREYPKTNYFKIIIITTYSS